MLLRRNGSDIARSRIPRRHLLLRRHRILHGAAVRRTDGRSDDRGASTAQGMAQPDHRTASRAAGRRRDGGISRLRRPPVAGFHGSRAASLATLRTNDQRRRSCEWRSFAFLISCAPALAQQPYAGLETRAIKTLSERQIADLNAGRGMGLALAAELNGYPGPMHAIELADRLNLSPATKEGRAPSA